MKKYLTAAALLAAGTAFANASVVLDTTSVTLSTNIPEGVTANGGNYSSVIFSLSSDWLSGALSAEEYKSFNLSSVTIEGRADSGTTTYSWTSGYKLSIDNGSGVYYAVSAALTTDETGKFATFTFETPVALDISTTYYLKFVTSGTYLNGTTVSGGSFQSQQLAAYSNTDLGTTDTTGGFIGTTGNATGYKANISLAGTAIAIPEPSAFGLLAGAGALALVAARRRRAK